MSVFQLWARSCLLAVAGAMVTLTGASVVHAQGAYPTRNGTFIWPFAAGNPSGEAIRVYAEETGKILGRPMTTDFRGGAGGRLGLQAVMAAPPDGYLVAAALDAGGWIINPDTSPDDFTKLVRSDIATWSPIVRRTGLKID